MMNREQDSRRARLATPRAAGIAGIAFSVLFITALVLIWTSIPTDPRGSRDLLAGSERSVALALNLVPFAGIAFLWFIGVVRDRLGQYEDKLFATVFLGSGLLFLAMMFAAAAMAGAVLVVNGAGQRLFESSDAYAFGRAVTYVALNTYAMRMAGVFMIASCTLFVRTGVMPRWMVWLGYGLALVLLLTLSQFSWMTLVFPVWVFLISLYILIENLRGKRSNLALSTLEN